MSKIQKQKAKKKSSKSGSRFLSLTISGLKSTFRDKLGLGGLFAYPIVAILIVFFAFGFDMSYESTYSVTIINNDIEGVAVPETSNQANASLLLCEILNSDKYSNFIVEGYNAHTYEEARELLNFEGIDAIIVIGRNFSESIYDLVGYEDEQPEVIITTINDIVVEGVVGSTIAKIVNTISINVSGAPQADIAAGKIDAIAFTIFELLAPGIIIGAIITCLGHLTVSYGMQKEIGTMQRLFTTPAPTHTILLSDMLCQFITAMVQFTMMITLSLVLGAYFHPNINWPVLFAIAMLFNLSAMGIGLILGSLVKNGGAAAALSFLVVFTIQMMGNVYTPPTEPMPGSAFVPTSYAVHAFRSIMLNGVSSWEIIGIDIIFLTIFGLVTIAIGLICFNQKFAIKK
jgi:ABC-2 type transport system permease protein